MSNAAHASEAPLRQRLGRWVVVEHAHAESLERAIQRQWPDEAVTRVSDIFAALGEASQAPVGALLAPVGAVAGIERATAEAMRRLAPSARLLLSAEDDQVDAAERSLAEGFDGWVPATPSDEALRDAAGGEARPRRVSEERKASLRRRAEAADRPVDRFGRLIRRTADRGPVERGGDAAAANEVGDVDLIRAVLGGKGARSLAVDVARARSGLAGMLWVESIEQTPRGSVAEPITFAGRTFGCLCAASPVSVDDLSAWAAWLAHWLALDEQMRQLRDMSMRDALTGMWNRRYFDRFLQHVLTHAGRERSQVTLMVFDIDDFKLYNDKYGHAAGDEILREASRLMLSVVRDHDVVARIGGDEFAVIFWDAEPHAPRNPQNPNSRHPEDVRKAATRFQQAILKHHFPKLFEEAPGTLTISGGLASFPWDGRTPDELLARADERALQSKRQGKNAITFGPGAAAPTET
jgi:two-component system cell cycle response regulator